MVAHKRTPSRAKDLREIDEAIKTETLKAEKARKALASGPL
jgi:hypothetical protein